MAELVLFPKQSKIAEVLLKEGLVQVVLGFKGTFNFR